MEAGDILYRRGLLDKRQLELSRTAQAEGTRLLDAAVDLGFVSEEEALRALGEEVGLGLEDRLVGAGVAQAMRFGVARGYDDVVGMTIGTGIGAGAIIDGRPLATRNLAGGVSYTKGLHHWRSRLSINLAFTQTVQHSN
mgnify:CR=1 FL=1